MGNVIGNKGNKRKRVVVLGIKEVGQTAIWQTLNPGMQYIVPSAFNTCNVQTWSYKNLDISSWNCNADYLKSRILFRHYYQSIDAILFIVQSESDMTMAHNAFHRVLNDLGPELRHIPILIFCNETNMKVEEVRYQMGFFRYYCFSQSELNDIKRNSLMNNLPKDIFDVTMEYAMNVENRLSVQRTADLLMNMDIGLIDRYFAGEKISKYVYSYSQQNIDILHIICAYLPRYKYNDLSSKQYALLKGSVHSRKDVDKAMAWLINATK